MLCFFVVLFLLSFICLCFSRFSNTYIVSRSLVIKKLTKVYPVQFLNEIVIKAIHSCAPRILMGITQQFCDSGRRTQNAIRYHENSVNSVWPYEYIFIHLYFVMLSGCLLLFFFKMRINLHVLSMICSVYSSRKTVVAGRQQIEKMK